MLSIFLSINLSFYLVLILSIILSIFCLIYFSSILLFYLLLVLSFSLLFYLSVFHSLYSISHSIYCSLFLSVFLSMALSIFHFIYVSLSLSFCCFVCLWYELFSNRWNTPLIFHWSDYQIAPPSPHTIGDVQTISASYWNHLRVTAVHFWKNQPTNVLSLQIKLWCEKVYSFYHLEVHANRKHKKLDVC